MTTTDSTPAAECVEDEGLVTVPRRHWYSVRIIRTTTLDNLSADIAQADRDVKTYEAEAEQWHEAYCQEAELANKAEARADKADEQIEDLRRRLDKTATELRGMTDEAEALRAVIKQVTRERDTAREELAADHAAIEQLGREAALIKAAAEDPAKGETVRAAIALGVLRRLIKDARDRGSADRWLDLLDMLLGGAPTDTTSTTAGKESDQ
ncbi:hypothetical protein AB4212_04070 [Streptomyces sp. 2MCAF27]